MGRAPCCDKDNVKRGPWSPEEDSKLKAYIQQNGTGGNWIALPKKVGLKRCGKSCRLRWLNYLRPNIKHGGFSEEEDNIICSLYISIGSRWSIIAAQLPGRTDNDIKNYWNTRLKKKLLGKRKDQHNRRLAARAKQPEVNEHTNVHEKQPTACEDHHMIINMNNPYANFGPGIAPQLFEHTICADVSTIADTSPSTQSAKFQLNLQQASDQQLFVPNNNNSYRKLLERFEGTLDDFSNDMNMNSTCQMEPSNWISNDNNNASQIPDSTVQIAAQVSYDTTAAPSLEYARCMENNFELECPAILGAPLPENDNSLVFPASSSISCGDSPEGINYQSNWMSTFNAENDKNVDMEGYEFSMDWDDILYCTKTYSSLVLEQKENNYGCGPALGGTVDGR